MNAFDRLRWMLAEVFEQVLGPRTVIDVTQPRTHLESLSGHSHEGYVTQVFCQELKYKVRYQRWFVPDRHYYVYKVFCTVQGKAPEALLRAFARECSFPLLLTEWSSSTAQKTAAIEAYLDVIHADLQRSQKNGVNGL